MEEKKKYLKDILLTKRPFTYKDKDTGEEIKMYEVFTMTEEPYNENGYIVKQFYAKPEKVEYVQILDKIEVRYSHKYKKFYAL